jgi:transposase
LRQIQAEMEKRSGTQHLWRVLRRMGFHLQKVTPRGRAGHRNQPQAATLVPGHVLCPCAGEIDFLDESGVTVGMTPRYARCLGGGRIHEGTLQGHWKILTMLGAMSSRGMLAMMTIEEATDTDIFLACLDHVLCPKLKPGDVVVIDNLSSHKVDGVRQRIEQCGAELLYLPPYSPDLNPIEKAWAKLKQILRSTHARAAEALDQIITDALPQITPDNAQAWFRLRLGPIHQ